MMPEFQYNALKRDGERVDGLLEVSNRAAALNRIMDMDLTPLSINPPKNTLWQNLTKERQFHGKFNYAEFCRSMTRFLESGLTLERSLGLSAAILPARRDKRIIESLLKSVRQGASLAASMQVEKKYFPEDLIAQIAAGERTGSLTIVMDSLATSLERSLTFKTKVRSALVYPAILMGVVLLTIVLVVGVVLPRFMPLFASSSESLPLLTQMVVFFGGFLMNFWWLWVGMLILVFGGILSARNNHFLQEKWHGFVFERSWLRGMILSSQFIKLARGWGVGIESGLSVDESLNLVNRSIMNKLLQQNIQKILKDVRLGKNLSIILQQHQYIPIIMQQLILAGDETGRLGPMLREAANLMETEYAARLERITNLLAPILTLVAGLIVALLVLAVMMGMISINDLAF